jgi:UDP-N-acetylmuramate dehydrogenase
MLPADWLRRFDGRVEREHRLAPHTTWRIGGPAELFLEPASLPALVDAVRHLWQAGIPWRVLGGGSNLLVSDGGVRGAVVSLERLHRVEHAGCCIIAEAGAYLHHVVSFAAERGLAGLNCLAGIPGRVGGAVFGNAGSRLGAIGPRVRVLDLLEPDGHLTRVEPDPGFFRYRASDVGARIVVRAFLEVQPGDAAALREQRDALLRERLATQPPWIGNAGCVFKNPEGASAGRLIDLAGGKELRAGGIRVSEKHANFFENEGGGSASDVQRLVDRVTRRVREVHGVDLEMEVRRWD